MICCGLAWAFFSLCAALGGMAARITRWQSQSGSPQAWRPTPVSS
ncbi:MAG: hypothetical protein RI907_2238 [Pseudomonadota bacterium]|jgi:hypothetical protein